MNYYKKYIKYKNKYLMIKKNMKGGTYTGLRYIGEGAESIVYDMGDGKVLKIIKNQNMRISDRERSVIEAVKDIPNFPKVYIYGLCKNNIKPDRETNVFCVDNGSEYQYIIMDKIDGKDILEIFYDKFKDYLNLDEIELRSKLEDETFVSKITKFVHFYINIIKKIVSSLKIANDAVRFRHNDFDFRNCLISPTGEPTIIDFGQSTIGNPSLECKDIFSYVNSFLGGSYCNRKDTIIKTYGDEHTIRFFDRCNKNCKTILAILRDTPKITQLQTLINECVPYWRRDISLDMLLNRISSL